MASKKRIKKPELEQLPFASAAALEAWLANNHQRSLGIWLMLAKKDSAVATVSYADARDLALCFGWIDGQAKRIDDTFYALRFTPRGKNSVWSKINVGRVEALTKAGRMREAGKACVAAAKKDGRWERAYDPPSQAKVPDDLQAALAADKHARAAFDALDASSRFSMLTRLQLTKTPQARLKKLAGLMEILSSGQMLQASRSKKATGKRPKR